MLGLTCDDPNDICVCKWCPVPDFGGLCEPEPVTCDNSCAPVCDCSGTTYRNRCEWILNNPPNQVYLDDIAGCDEVWGVLFLEKNELRWGTYSDEFNVYRTVLTGGGPPGTWNCAASGLTTRLHVVSGTPPSGETWAFVVTKVDGGLEGPLGWGGTGCTERTNVVVCPP
jgi:hypothetical protein